VFEDSLGLRKKNGPSRSRTYWALAVSLLLHGLLVYGVFHAHITIRILNVGTRVQNVRVVPPIRLTAPKIVGAPPQRTTPSEGAAAEPGGAGVGPGGRRPRAEAPVPPPAPNVAQPAIGPTGQGPVVLSLATRFRESLASRYRTEEGPGLRIVLSPPGTAPSAGIAPAKRGSPDFYQYLSGAPGTGEAGRGAGAGGSAGQRASISIPLRGYNLAPWAQRVLELIMKNWDLPWTSGLSGRTQVRVVVVVRKNGELASVELVEGTARDVLDEAALGAVRASLPFPALPDDFPGDFLEASIEFTYHD